MLYNIQTPCFKGDNIMTEIRTYKIDKENGIFSWTIKTDDKDALAKFGTEGVGDWDKLNRVLQAFDIEYNPRKRVYKDNTICL